MYLKNDRIVATIKDITFRSFKMGTEGQFVLDPTALTGWDDGTNVRRDATVRPVSSGDYTEPYTFSARLIAFSGTAIAPDRKGLQVLRDKLAGVLTQNEYAELKVETSASTRYATVGLEGKVEWVQQLDNVASFRVEFYAPDPHLYGSEKRHQVGRYLVSGGLRYRLSYPLNYFPSEEAITRTTTNNGNAIAYPVFVAIGDFYSGFSIMTGFGGKKVTYTGIATKQSPVYIDMARGTATQGGVDKTALVTSREWFGIPPNTTMTPVFAPLSGNDEAGAGWCDIIYRDTWI
jgi:Phage tail protein.